MGKNSKFLKSYHKLRGNPVNYQGGGFNWQEGSVMDQNSGAVSGLLGMGSSLVDTIDPGDQWGKKSMAGGIGSGALKGAAAGAALGPLGMAGGALIGGVTSAISTKKGNEEAEKAKFAHQSAMRMDARNFNLKNDMTTFNKKGGRLKRIPPKVMVPLGNGAFQSISFLDGGNLMQEFGPGNNDWIHEYFERPGETVTPNIQGYARGGQVQQISDRAVKFKGNNPGATDDIELSPGTFVDHNEAMVETPEGEIIASDSVFLGGGKRSVASQVKALQAKKSKARSPKRRGFYDYRTDVKLAQQELEAGRVDPQTVMAMAEPGGDKRRHGGIGDKDPNFHPDLAKDVNFRDGGLQINEDIISRVSEYCKGGRKARRMEEGGKVHTLAENESNEELEEQLEMGIPVEAEEHKTSLTKGKTIAGQHLKEDKNYYTKLKKAGLNKGGSLSEYVFEHGIYDEELDTEPGHEPGSATFRAGGQYYNDRAKGLYKQGGLPQTSLTGTTPEVQKGGMAKLKAGKGMVKTVYAGGGTGEGIKNPAGKTAAPAMAGRYIPGEYDYLSGDLDAQTPLGSISRGEFEAFQADPTQIPAMRGQVADATWTDISNKFKDPTIQGLNLSNMHFQNADGSRTLEYGDKIMGEYVDPLGGLPKMQGTGMNQLSGTNAPQTLEGIPMGSKKTNAFKYNTPRGKKFRQGLNKMMGYQEGGEIVLERPDQTVPQESTIMNTPSYAQGVAQGIPEGGYTKAEMWKSALTNNSLLAEIEAEHAESVQNLDKTSLAAKMKMGYNLMKPIGEENFAEGGLKPIGPQSIMTQPANKEYYNNLPMMAGAAPITDAGRMSALISNAGLPTTPVGGIQAPALPETLSKVPVGPGGGPVGDQRNPNMLHDFAKGAAVFGPDILNSINYLNTPKVPTPTLNKPVNLQRMSNRSQMAQISEAGRSADKAILSQGSQLGATMAGINANMATKMGAIGKANESLRNMNASIGNREAILNSRVGMMNTGLKNKFKSDQLGRQLGIRRGLAGVASSIGNKGQGLFAEKDKKAMDQLAIKAMEKGFPTGVWQRAYTDLLDKSNKQRGLNRD